jgi:hypothetical protein
LQEARDELAKLRDEQSGIMAERKEAVLNGSPIAPIEKRLGSVQAKVA